jgi:type I restriction enzyme S subunit
MADLNKNKLGYKKTKVGWIPEEWAFINFGKMVNSSAFGPRFSSDLYDEEGNVGTLRTTDMDESGNINYSGMPIAKVEIDKFQSHLLEENDLVISRSGTIGVTGLFKGFEKPVLPGAFLIRFRLKKQNTVPIYFKYFFNSTLGRRMLNRISGGGVQKNLKGSSALALKLPLPPLPEQRAIAAILSTWDAAIDKLGQLIAKKQALKKGLMQQLLSGRVRFPEFVPPGGTRYKETKVGVVPEDWEVVRMEEIGLFFKGKGISKKEIKKEGFPAVRYGELYTKFNVTIKKCHGFIDDDSASKSKVAEKYDILFPCSGETAQEIGKPSMLLIENTYISGDIIAFRAKNVNPLYLSYSLNSTDAIKARARIAQGVSVVHIYPKDLKSLNVYLPPIEEQNKIALTLQKLDDELYTIREKRYKIQTQKKGLMQQLLTGAVRVKEGIATESFIDENP